MQKRCPGRRSAARERSSVLHPAGGNQANLKLVVEIPCLSTCQVHEAAEEPPPAQIDNTRTTGCSSIEYVYQAPIINVAANPSSQSNLFLMVV